MIVELLLSALLAVAPWAANGQQGIGKGHTEFRGKGLGHTQYQGKGLGHVKHGHGGCGNCNCDIPACTCEPPFDCSGGGGI